MSLENILSQARTCRLCEAHLDLGPRPVVVASKHAKILLIGQAPGTKVHNSGIPWQDASGERLRDWMQVKPELFYNPDFLSIMPMGFCYPGKIKNGGDKPPRPECAPKWHNLIRSQLPNIRYTLLVGSHAQKYYLDDYKTMTEAVANYRQYLKKGIFPIPHPSWRTTAWQKKNPWFDADVLPTLRNIMNEASQS